MWVARLFFMLRRGYRLGNGPLLQMLESAIDSQAGSQAVGKVFHLFVGMFLWHGSDTRERTQ